MSEKSIYEESTLKLKAQVVEGTPAVTKVSFAFETSDGAVETIAGQEVNHGDVVEVKLPKVKDEADSYTMTYKMTHDGNEQSGAVKYVVWPQAISVEAKLEDGKPAAGASFHCSQALAQPADANAGQGQAQAEPKLFTRVFQADANGKVSCRPLDLAPATVGPASPWAVVRWDREQGRAKQVVVERLAYQAELIARETSTGDGAELDGEHERQWVNLAAKNDDPFRASRIKLRTRAQGDTPGAANCLGAKGDKIYIEVKYTPENADRYTTLYDGNGWTADCPQPGLLIAGQRVKAEADKKTWKAEVTLAGGGLPSAFEVELGRAAGDKFEISVGVKQGEADATLKVVNWRKLFYQVTRPSSIALPNLDSTKQMLAEVYIELVAQRETVLNSGEGDPSAWIDKDEFPFAVQCQTDEPHLVIGPQNKDRFTFFRDPTASKPSVHVILCHMQLDATRNGAPFTLNIKKKLGKGARNGIFDIKKLSGDGDAEIFKNSLVDGRSAIRKATWKLGSKSGTLDASCFSFGSRGLMLVLPTDVYNLATSKNGDVEVTIELHYALGWYNGWALDGGQNVIRVTDDTTAEGFGNVLRHEIGHLINQAPKGAVPPGLDINSHDRRYSRTGPHCATGSSKEQYEAANCHRGYATMHPDGTAECVMYGSGTLDERHAKQFCDKCKPFVMAEPCVKL